MSSFKRAVKGPSTASPSSSAQEANAETGADSYISVTGVKPWVNTGLGIVSSGNKQLDELIGGGSALGTLTFVESDAFSNYGETLALYSLAESISHKHAILVVSEDSTEAEHLMAALPYNQTIGRAGNASGEGQCVVGENPDSNKLTIAWQYGKYIKSKDASPAPVSSSGEIPAPTYCCSYDLSRRLQSSMLENAIVELCPANTLTTPNYIRENNNMSHINIEIALNRVILAVKEFVAKHNKSPKSVSRIVISSLDQILSAVGENNENNLHLTSTIVARFALQIKHVIRSTRVSVLMYANPGSLSTQTVAKLRQVSDTVLSVESFAGRTHSVPYEFKDFQGFLVVHKLQQYGSMAPFRPPGTRFGLKRDRRKLHIEPLHLPPEESRAFSTTGGATPPVSAENAVPSGTAGAGGPKGDGMHTHGESGSARSSGAGANQVPAVASVASAEANLASAGAVLEPAAPAPAKLTPLQASLAALKAARLSGTSTSANIVSATAATAIVSGGAGSASVVTPVSIQRPVPAANIINKPAHSARQPPLQPGQACGASKESGNADSKYDF